MKAILEFNLPEDQVDFQDATNGSKWSFAMWKVDQELRSKTKYAPDTMSKETYDALEAIRDFLYEQMSEQGLKFD
jgi:hypothetical protein